MGLTATEVDAQALAPAPLGAPSLLINAFDVAAPAQGTWWALHTMSRHEKAVAQTLEGARIAHYLPLVRTVRVYGHRRRVVESPLFSCYVFLYGSREDTRFALESGRVARALAISDQARVRRELSQIRAALGSGAELELYPYLAQGRRVRVRSGPFKGIEGVVEDRAGAHRLILQVHALNRATSLEIDAGLLEAAE